MRQTSEAQREKGRQRSYLEREIKNEGEIFLLKEQHENFASSVTK